MSNVLGMLRVIFTEVMQTQNWDEFGQVGNPAASPMVAHYLKQLKQQVAISGILPTQAKPLFLSKIKKIVKYIDENIASASSITTKYVLSRDRSFPLFQFFAGDRCSQVIGSGFSGFIFFGRNSDQ